ncbi:MAG TPA: RNA-binding protein [Thermoanaerobaculia bacterium]|nr:RNA-binding protein [Thermoanaerobaculia bacterium]
MKLHIGNLPPGVSDDRLRELMQPYGAPESAEVVKDRVSGTSRGFGFVVFSTAEEAQAAITGLNGQSVEGSAITVGEARSPRDRERTRS